MPRSNINTIRHTFNVIDACVKSGLSISAFVEERLLVVGEITAGGIYYKCKWCGKKYDVGKMQKHITKKHEDIAAFLAISGKIPVWKGASPWEELIGGVLS